MSNIARNIHRAEKKRIEAAMKWFRQNSKYFLSVIFFYSEQTITSYANNVQAVYIRQLKSIRFDCPVTTLKLGVIFF